jgi:hypothetical protein
MYATRLVACGMASTLGSERAMNDVSNSIRRCCKISAATSQLKHHRDGWLAEAMAMDIRTTLM